MNLARLASESPQNFARLARQYSEDTITRDTGGSLGGIAATELLRTPEILDALASMRPGDLSHVVETHCGFHVLYRRPAPPNIAVSGSRLVIGHDGARWLHRFGARRSIPARPRSQALSLATELYERAKAHPDQFSDLIHEYSEHRDAIDDGDLGEWSTHENSAIPREIEILQGLADWELAPPIEGLFGFEILQRTPNRPRKHFAMEAIQIFFDADEPEDGPLSKTLAAKTIDEIVKTLSQEPSAWERLRRENCCDGLQTWSEGRAPRELASLLEHLTPGEITNRTIEWNSSFVIAMDMRPDVGPPTILARHDLPAPSVPDVRFLVSGGLDPVKASKVLRGVCEDIAAALHLPSQEARSLQDLHGLNSIQSPANSYIPVSSDERWSQFERILRQVEEQFGPAGAVRYQEALKRRLEAAVLSTDSNQILRPMR